MRQKQCNGEPVDLDFVHVYIAGGGTNKTISKMKRMKRKNQ